MLEGAVNFNAKSVTEEPIDCKSTEEGMKKLENKSDNDEQENGGGSVISQKVIQDNEFSLQADYSAPTKAKKKKRSSSVPSQRGRSSSTKTRSHSHTRTPTRSRSQSKKSRSRTKSPSWSRSRKRSSTRSRSASRPKPQKKKPRVGSRSYSRSRSPVRRHKASRSGSSAKRHVSRSSSSSSRDTYGSFKALSPTRPAYDYPCRKCDRDFETIRELCEHEIRVHGASFPCPHCEKQASSVQKLCDHMKRRHNDSRLLCDFCKDDFGGRVSGVKDTAWEEFRDHVYKECLKEKIYIADRQRGRSGGVAQRGRGRCPHGPPVKCKNFPNCPGEKCYYFHGYCRYDKLCVKKECPFDHTDRPRVCLSCLRDYKDCKKADEKLFQNRHVIGFFLINFL